MKKQSLKSLHQLEVCINKKGRIYGTDLDWAVVDHHQDKTRLVLSGYRYSKELKTFIATNIETFAINDLVWARIKH